MGCDPHARSDERPWGRWDVVFAENDYRVKRISVRPGARLSYQTHRQRSEHWLIVRGSALATLDGKEIRMKPGDALDVPVGAAHRVANTGAEELVILEIQRGAYFGEDDIVRLHDDYGRAAEPEKKP